jgi:pantetheine-phosphate adenylyltransferase
MADEEYAHVSSTLIKQIAAMSDGRSLAKFVPAQVIVPLITKTRIGSDSPPDPSVRGAADG